MSRIAVIGASGYLGGNISKYLQEQGHDVIGVYREHPKDPENVLEKLWRTLQGDIEDSAFLKEIVSTAPEIIVYTVSLNHHDCEKDYLRSINVNVSPVMELGRLLSEQSSFKRFIYFSTLQVYGKIDPGEVIKEDRPIQPNNLYGLTHAFCEDGLSLLQRNKGLQSVCIRLSNGYGTPAFLFCDCWWLVLNDFCRTATQRR